MKQDTRGCDPTDFPIVARHTHANVQSTDQYRTAGEIIKSFTVYGAHEDLIERLGH